MTTLDDDIGLVVRSLFVGMRRVIAEPVSQEWIVIGTRSKHGIKIDIRFPKKIQNR